MGLDGGGGGGGGILGVTGSFTGPAEALEIVGQHAYAYSGSIAIDGTTNDNTYLKFTTGNYYFVGSMQGNVSSLPGAGTDDFQYKIFFNGGVIQSYIIGGAKPTSHNEIWLVIPPYTEVKITAADITQGSSIQNCISLAGRIYRD